MHSKQMEKYPAPLGVKKIFKKGGTTIPVVFVTTADAEEGLMAVSYNKMKADMRDAVKSAAEALKGKNVLGASAASSEEEEAKSLSGDSREELSEWTNNEGVTIEAQAIQIDLTEVTFRLASGKVVKYPLAKLSQESRERLKEQFQSE